jgi:NAD(P)H-hydrate epimerase
MARLVLNAEEMRALDRLAIETIGIPAPVLMESAGRQVAEVAHGLLGRAGRILVLAGVGNNGGDGLVAARHLKERGHELRVVVIGAPERASPDFRLQLEIWLRLGGTITTITEEAFDLASEEVLAEAVRHSELLIDAIFGTGLSRPLSPKMMRIITTTDLSPGPTVSVDVPSGLDASSGQELGAAVHADVTVTFQLPKLGLLPHPGRFRAGRLEVVDIGIPLSLTAQLPTFDTAAELLDAEDLERALEPRLPDAHKGTFGHVLIVAGVPDRPGSALLAARAAARVGAGLVTIGSDEETVRRLSPAFLELMGATLGARRVELPQLLAALDGKRALVLGPSLPPAQVTEYLASLLSQLAVPVVLDAGALSSITDLSVLHAHADETVLTPHPGEAATLLNTSVRAVQADRPGAARELATRSRCTVVLKGAGTLIAGPSGRLGIVDRGHPALATAGTGDVLAGVIGGLLAQGLPPRRAARAGVLLHAIAGERAAKLGGEKRLVASDLLEHLMRDLDPES